MYSVNDWGHAVYAVLGGRAACMGRTGSGLEQPEEEKNEHQLKRERERRRRKKQTRMKLIKRSDGQHIWLPIRSNGALYAYGNAPSICWHCSGTVAVACIVFHAQIKCNSWIPNFLSIISSSSVFCCVLCAVFRWGFYFSIRRKCWCPAIQKFITALMRKLGWEKWKNIKSDGLTWHLSCFAGLTCFGVLCSFFSIFHFLASWFRHHWVQKRNELCTQFCNRLRRPRHYL